MTRFKVDRLKALCLAVVLCLFAASCAPRIETPGPTAYTPAFSGDAFIMSDGYRLPVQVTIPKDTPPSAVLIALHGFNDYANAVAKQAIRWADSGIATYAYDQRGFGRTEGRGLWHGAEAMTRDVAEVADILRQRYPNTPILGFGISMGGAVLLAGLTDPTLTPPHLDGVILSAPAIWGRAVMPWWQRWPLTVLAHTLPWLEVAPRIQRRPSDNIEMLRAIGRDPLFIRRTRIDAIHGLVGLMDRAYAGLPKLGDNVLLLFGEQEDILPEEAWRGGMARLTPNAGWRLAVYETGFHMLTRDLNAEIVLSDIIAFIQDQDAPLPSGRELSFAPLRDE